MKLGTQEGLAPGHIVLDGDLAPPWKGAQQPPLSKFTGGGFACVHIIRDPCLLWPNGCMDKMPFGTEVGLGPGHIVLNGDPALPKKGHSNPQVLAHVCGQLLDGSKYHLVGRYGLGSGHIGRWGPS